MVLAVALALALVVEAPTLRRRRCTTPSSGFEDRGRRGHRLRSGEPRTSRRARQRPSNAGSRRPPISSSAPATRRCSSSATSSTRAVRSRAFDASYDPTWGRREGDHEAGPGNHEYAHRAARPATSDYFGAAAATRAKGYYSYDVGDWHVVALNSNCADVGGCDAGSAQERWLRADLAAHPARCTLAYWHHPRFSSGEHGSDSTYARVLAGALRRERRPRARRARPRLRAVRAAGRRRCSRPRARNPSVRRRDGRQEACGGSRASRRTARRATRRALGVLELTLGASAYEWRFRPRSGRSRTRFRELPLSC